MMFSQFDTALAQDMGVPVSKMEETAEAHHQLQKHCKDSQGRERES